MISIKISFFSHSALVLCIHTFCFLRQWIDRCFIPICANLLIRHFTVVLLKRVVQLNKPTVFYQPLQEWAELLGKDQAEAGIYYLRLLTTHSWWISHFSRLGLLFFLLWIAFKSSITLLYGLKLHKWPMKDSINVNLRPFQIMCRLGFDSRGSWGATLTHFLSFHNQTCKFPPLRNPTVVLVAQNHHQKAISDLMDHHAVKAKPVSLKPTWKMQGLP